jgi:outer membrane protein OmpA-like peptidoglycan-associated protein
VIDGPPLLRRAEIPTRDPEAAPVSESGPDDGNGSPEDSSPAPADPLKELRRLLFVPEEAQVSKIQERLDDPEIHAEDVSSVLPDAIRIGTARDDKLARSLQPTVEDAILTSVRRDPQVLVDALFPVMGPAIRKAISSALASMLESFNETLERSFSAQGVRWRLEAWRTGKPLAEVILLRTLVYRVEQVFLIHRKTGLLLQHVSAIPRRDEDADMIAGMLTAIRDFVHDSFGGREGDSLDTFQVGELSVWVEPGPLAAIAAVIRGNAPKDLRGVFTDAIERIHREQAVALDAFEGDAAPFERSLPLLEACLKGERRKRADRTIEGRTGRAVRFLRVAAAVLLVAVAAWGVASYRRNQRWNAYLGRLASEPGIVVTTSGRRGGKYFVNGLRDPLAADPVAMLAASRFSARKVASDWSPYQALAPEIIAKRARTVLDAPASVALAVRDGALVATGSASGPWIAEARARARAIAGISRYDDAGLADADSTRLEALRRRIEERVLLFPRGSSELPPAESAKLRDTTADVGEVARLATALDRSVRIEVIGRGDSVGTEETNLALSRRRAERIVEALRAAGGDAVTLAADGVGSARPLKPEVTEEDRDWNRSVSFHLVAGMENRAGSPRR